MPWLKSPKKSAQLRRDREAQVRKLRASRAAAESEKQERALRRLRKARDDGCVGCPHLGDTGWCRKTKLGPSKGLDTLRDCLQHPDFVRPSLPVDVPYKDPRRDRKILDPHAERAIFALSPHERARERAARMGIPYGRLRWNPAEDGNTRIGLHPRDIRWLPGPILEKDPNPNWRTPGRSRRCPSLEELEEMVPFFWPKVI